MTAVSLQIAENISMLIVSPQDNGEGIEERDEDGGEKVENDESENDCNEFSENIVEPIPKTRYVSGGTEGDDTILQLKQLKIGFGRNRSFGQSSNDVFSPIRQK